MEYLFSKKQGRVEDKPLTLNTSVTRTVPVNLKQDMSKKCLLMEEDFFLRFLADILKLCSYL